MSTVRIGIVGCGGIAKKKHVPSLKKPENVELVAFCDIISECAEKAAEYGVPGGAGGAPHLRQDRQARPLLI